MRPDRNAHLAHEPAAITLINAKTFNTSKEWS